MCILEHMSIRKLLLGAALLSAIIGTAHPQDLIESELRIPMLEAGERGLEAVMVRPNDSDAHPLALLNHGSPRDSRLRPGMTAWGLLTQAREFARRGWTTVMVLRRGFGSSGGEYADTQQCASPDYYGSGRESARDLAAAIRFLSNLPQVDRTRIISVGVSAGGFATVALTADPPPGLLAGISFAGGRGSKAPDEVCSPDALVRAFAAFGSKSRIPMLWVYSENDHFFGPRLAAQFYREFEKAGGQVSFILAPPFGKDGHHLFSYAGTSIWTPMVDAFLGANHLQWRDSLLDLPAAPDLSPPGQLSPQGRELFRYFLTLPPKRAFAISSNGHFGYAFGRRTAKDAAQAAKENCDEVDTKGYCAIAYTDENLPSP
jgi:dienelactone hydrolase